eukprot:gene3829-7629_t
MNIFFVKAIILSAFAFSFSNAFRYSKINTSLRCKASFQSSSLRASNDVLTEDEKDAALIMRVEAEVLAESGVGLEDLINPSKVINLSREIEKLLLDKQQASSEAEKLKIQGSIDKKQSSLAIEKRGVMRGWLKNLFVGQSVLALVASIFMVYDIVPGTPLPLAVRVLGFWMWWLFIIPSLRARKPSAAEKDALNWAFIGSPLISVALPAVTKDIALIWWANFVVVAACYGYAFLKPPTQSEGSAISESEMESPLPPFLRQALKALDYGSGQERGLRK